MKTANCKCGKVVNYLRKNVKKRILKIGGLKKCEIEFVYCPNCYERIIVNENEAKE